jgi:hypothetical protein
MNIALLLKWAWRLSQDEDAIWATLIRAKYRNADNLWASSGLGGSQFWKSLNKIKHYFALGAKFVVRNGIRTRFWLDWWCGDAPLKDRFPLLFSICELPEGSVAQALTDGEVSIRLRRSLDLEGVRQWNLLCAEMAQVQLSEEKTRCCGT